MLTYMPRSCGTIDVEYKYRTAYALYKIMSFV